MSICRRIVVVVVNCNNIQNVRYEIDIETAVRQFFCTSLILLCLGVPS